MRFAGIVVALAFFLGNSSLILAQTKPAASAETITLGASAATLPGPWKFARTEALVAALPLLLFEFSRFNAYFLHTFGFSGQFYPFRIGISIGAIADILMILGIGALVLRHFLRTQVQEELAGQSVAQEIEQAQQLQQRVLVPETVRSTFFNVEAEYRPAQTVDGDFFQTLTRPDGSLLVVIGDVSGKGISAAMLVAVPGGSHPQPRQGKL